MIIYVYNHPSESRKLRLACLGDFHLGHAGCDKKKLLTDLKWIKQQDNLLVFLMGDYLDNQIPYISKKEYITYYEIDDELNTFEKAYDYLMWLLTPIKDKIIGMHLGNHDFSFVQRAQYNFVKALSKELKTLYLDNEALGMLKIGQKHTENYIIYSVHGSYTGRRIGGKLNKLEDISNYYEADIYFMAHVHELGGWRTIRQSIKLLNGQLVLREQKRVYALTGTYFRAHQLNTSSYAERRQYSPNKIGLITVEISPRRRDIHVKE